MTSLVEMKSSLVYFYLLSIACLLSSGFTFELNCVDFEVESFGDIGSPLTCRVEGLKVTKKGEVMTGSADSNIDLVQGMLLHQLTVNFLPKFSQALKQNLQYLQIIECDLKSIEKDDLAQFPTLLYLVVDRNPQLESLKSDLFKATPDLKHICFSNDNLKTIGANILEPLKDLQVALFAYNPCISFRAFKKEQFEELKTKLKECQPK
jgi:hypothetical protein